MPHFVALLFLFCSILGPISVLQATSDDTTDGNCSVDLQSVTDTLLQIQSSITILLSESNRQNQDLEMVKDDLRMLKVGYVILQQTTDELSARLDNKLYTLRREVEQTQDCLEDFKNDTEQSLVDLQTGIDDTNDRLDILQTNVTDIVDCLETNKNNTMHSLAVLQSDVTDIGDCVETIKETTGTILIVKRGVPSLRFEESQYEVPEGDSVEVCVELVLSSDAVLDFPILATLGSMNGLFAIEGEDFSLNETMVIFAPDGASSNISCVTVNTVQDLNYEGDHMFQIIVTDIDPSVISSVNPVNVIITEDSDAVVSMVLETDTVDEDDVTVQVCVDPGVDGVVERTLTVTLDATNGSAIETEDFILPDPFTVEFNTSDTACTTVTIEQDDDVEGDHDFNVTISDVGPFAMLGTNTTTIITIEDDDNAVINMVIEMDMVGEGGRMIDVCLDASVNGSLDIPLTVTLIAINDSAVEIDDFTVPDNFIVELTSPAEACATVTIVDDTIIESDHEFTVAIYDVGPFAIVGSNTTTNITITDNDMGIAMINATKSTDMVNEGDEAIVCVMLTSYSGATSIGTDITVTLTDTSHSATAADYIEGLYYIPFMAGSSLPVYNCTSIQILNDSLVEDPEEVYVTITNVMPDGTFDFDPDDIFNITINKGIPRLQFEQSQYEVPEGDSVEVCVELVLNNDAVLDFPVFATLESMNGTFAIEGDDFSLNSTMVMFDPGDVSGNTSCITVNTVQDLNYEGNHMFQIMVTGTDSSCIPPLDPVDVVITEDNDTMVSMVMDTEAVHENDGTVEVCLDPGVVGVVERTLIVTLDAMNGTAIETDDFILPDPFTVEFNTSDTACTAVTIMQDDDLEADHEFTVDIIDVGPFAMKGTTTSTVITITDDDNAMINMVTGMDMVDEGNGTIDVCIDPGVSGSLDITLLVELTTIEGTAATPEDFNTSPPTTFFIFVVAPEVTCAPVMIMDDNITEANEYFTVSISDVGPFAIIGSNITTNITIIDNDSMMTG